mgnify:FL=1
MKSLKIIGIIIENTADLSKMFLIFCPLEYVGLQYAYKAPLDLLESVAWIM